MNYAKKTMTWEEICADPQLRNLHYKIEQDQFGRILMSPGASYGHGCFQAEIVILLGRLMPGWAARVECPVQTAEGVRVPDVAAVPRADDKRYRRASRLPQAPPICVEVLSPSNSPDEIEEKRRLYAAAGCQELWTCSEEGEMRFYSATDGSVLERSLLCPAFPPKIE